MMINYISSKYDIMHNLKIEYLLSLGLACGGFTLCPAEGSNYYISLAIFSSFLWTLKGVGPLNIKGSRLGRPVWSGPKSDRLHNSIFRFIHLRCILWIALKWVILHKSWTGYFSNSSDSSVPNRFSVMSWIQKERRYQVSHYCADGGVCDLGSILVMYPAWSFTCN